MSLSLSFRVPCVPQAVIELNTLFLSSASVVLGISAGTTSLDLIKNLYSTKGVKFYSKGKRKSWNGLRLSSNDLSLMPTVPRIEVSRAKGKMCKESDDMEALDSLTVEP